MIGIAVSEMAVWGRRQHLAARQLSQSLSLRSCSFQHGIAGLGRPARGS